MHVQSVADYTERVNAAPLLADMLGLEPKSTSLLAKARRLGLRTPDDLQRLVVARGCRHYSRSEPSLAEPISTAGFSNAELAIALLSPALMDDPHSIRCGAAMLGAEGNDPVSLARSAAEEGSVAIVRYVALAGQRYEPENAFWRVLLEHLPDGPPPPDGILPHPSRFVAMTGFVRGAGPGFFTEWQRPGRSELVRPDQR